MEGEQPDFSKLPAQEKRSEFNKVVNLVELNVKAALTEEGKENYVNTMDRFRQISAERASDETRSKFERFNWKLNEITYGFAGKVATYGTTLETQWDKIKRSWIAEKKK